MERALEHLNFLMKENESLKTLLKKKVQETRTFGSLESRANEFESNGVNAIKKVDEKVSYSSHFKQKEATSEYLHLRFNGIKSNVENPFHSHSEKHLVQENSQISKLREELERKRLTDRAEFEAKLAFQDKRIAELDTQVKKVHSTTEILSKEVAKIDLKVQEIKTEISAVKDTMYVNHNQILAVYLASEKRLAENFDKLFKMIDFQIDIKNIL
jgi:septal ring factor EnvC (AmiA/AmiB activator)